MRTHGHREGSITNWDLFGRLGEGQWGYGDWGEITWGEMPNIGDGEMEAANHLALYEPMQQSCMICTCTPEPKVQLKNERKKSS